VFTQALKFFTFSNTDVYGFQNKTLFRIIKVHENDVVQSYENKGDYMMLSLERNSVMYITA
jgi:hypothetical protein